MKERRIVRRHDGPYLELQLNPDPGLPKTHGKRIRECGGDYRAARGDVSRRYVIIPMTRTGITLAAELVERYSILGTYRKTGQRVNATPIIARNLTKREPVAYGSIDLRAWIAKLGRQASIEKRDAKARAAAEKARRADWQRMADVDQLHGSSLEAGERLASEFLFGASKP